MRDDEELMGCIPHALAANWLWGWIIKRFVTVKGINHRKGKPGGETGWIER